MNNGAEEGWRNLDPAKSRISPETAVEEHVGGLVRMHVICDVVCAVVVLAGQPWCAIAAGPNGLMMAFKEDKKPGSTRRNPPFFGGKSHEPHE